MLDKGVDAEEEGLGSGAYRNRDLVVVSLSLSGLLRRPYAW